MTAQDVGRSGILPDLERCPCCGRGLVSIDGISGIRRNYTSQVVVPGTAEPVYRECFACRARWHRYAPGHPLRLLADPWAAAWPAVGFRPSIAAWDDGVARVGLDGGWVDARRARDFVAGEYAVAAPLIEPLYVLSAWNPAARPQTAAANSAAHVRLLAEIRLLGVASRPAASYDAALLWAEPAVALSDWPQSKVLALARQFRQPAVQLLESGRLTVLDTASGQPFAGPEPVDLFALDWRGCPMRQLRQQPQVPGVCRNPGGPWVSASIHESARWDHQRTMLLESLGCDVCGGGPADGPGGRVVMFAERVVASRYGPARPV